MTGTVSARTKGVEKEGIQTRGVLSQSEPLEVYLPLAGLIGLVVMLAFVLYAA